MICKCNMQHMCYDNLDKRKRNTNLVQGKLIKMSVLKEDEIRKVIQTKQNTIYNLACKFIYIFQDKRLMPLTKTATQCQSHPDNFKNPHLERVRGRKSKKGMYFSG